MFKGGFIAKRLNTRTQRNEHETNYDHEFTVKKLQSITTCFLKHSYQFHKSNKENEANREQI